ncbi:unnamed protein product [Linum trigynum]|uniref:Hs1pro-1 C-terminal domain-containing protein n=1 Tax=Linum trigynum TaxID=586398 RepID=A0AAV2FK89_9ROSI
MEPFYFRSRSLVEITRSCKELKHKVPEILGVEEPRNQQNRSTNPEHIDEQKRGTQRTLNQKDEPITLNKNDEPE